MVDTRKVRALTGVRFRLHEIIFESDTRAGKGFDVTLLLLILVSVLTVMVESVSSFREAYGVMLRRLEWGVTILFTVEYLLRLYSVHSPRHYATSFFGAVDLLAIIPTYLSLFVTGTQSLQIIRALRLLRVFRVLKLAQYIGGARVLRSAIHAGRHKIAVFLVTVLNVAGITGALMYIIEGEESGFTNIPVSVYWAIVTMTTVGYGDIHPVTPLGQFVAAILMVMGYGIIAVPTGIVSAEIARADTRPKISTQACLVCSEEGHDPDAVHCKYCGARL